MYYNASITPWLNVTADLQIVEPGADEEPGLVGTTRDAGTAVVAGRAYARF